jgi:hypothetical protein
MGRVSSLEAARATLPSVPTNGSRGTENPPCTSKVDICGKSLAAQELRVKRALPAVTRTVPPSAEPLSTRTSSPTRLRTTSENRRAGTTTSPGSSTVTGMDALMEISMSVEYMSSLPSEA